MSLQEIEKSHIISGTVGYEKTIDVSSQKMMLDILQVTQYSKPIESTVRELCSNAVDAQREKEIALEIIQGKAKVEDYYVEREGEQYNASKFDPTYFDQKWLNKEKNNVEIIYEESSGTGFADQFIVIDHGSGIGMPRLKGYLSLGYSTKRATKHALGAYGIGAKSALSTGVPFYTLETAHNGKMFRFNAYAYKADSIVPKWEQATGEMNPTENIGTEEKPFLVHYEKTTSPNFTKIIVGVKRHNRQKYVQAVKHQLLYFKGVEFKYIYEDGSSENIPFLAKILFSSPSLIISETNQFSRPHAVVVKEKGSDFGVTYGLIDFLELEMESYYGSIGFKLPIRSVVKNNETGEEKVVQEGISVTPSRETILWDDHTKAYIKEVISEAKIESTKLIESELKSENLFEWLKKAEITLSGANSAYGRSALGVLSNLVPRSTLKPKFAPNPKIKYGNIDAVMSGYKVTRVQEVRKSWDSARGQYRIEIDRTPASSWNELEEGKVYMLPKGERHSVYKDRYLASIHGGSFVTIVELDEAAIEEDIILRNKSTKGFFEGAKELIQKQLDRNEIINGYLAQELKPSLYEDVKIPDDFNAKLAEEEREPEAATVTPTLTPAELRELNGQLPGTTFKYKHGEHNTRELKQEKVEPVVADLALVKSTVIYGVQADDEKLKSMCILFENMYRAEQNSVWIQFFGMPGSLYHTSTYPMILRVSKRNLKHVKNIENYINVDSYLYSHSEKTYQVGSYFLKYFTAKYLADNLKNIRFLRNFKEFDGALSEAFKKLDDYTSTYYARHISNALSRDNFFSNYQQLNTRLAKIQLDIRSNPNLTEEERRAIIGKEFFISEAGESSSEADVKIPDNFRYENIVVLDENILSVYDELVDYSTEVGELFNELGILTTEGGRIPEKAATLIKEILASKKLDQYEISEDNKNIINTIV